MLNKYKPINPPPCTYCGYTETEAMLSLKGGLHICWSCFNSTYQSVLSLIYEEKKS